MKSKIQKKVKYLAGILFVLGLSNAIVVGYAIEPSHGKESTEQAVPIYFLWWIVGYQYLDSVVDVQEHAVYDDSGNGGYENYALFLYGRNTNAGSIIYTHIYVTALYEEKVTVIPTGQVITNIYWGPPPIDFITWDGDMDYGASTPGVWQYIAGVTVYSFNFGFTCTSAAEYTAHPQVK